ncbi:MAG: PIN domain-containing protein [Planctomycetia bacterium]
MSGEAVSSHRGAPARTCSWNDPCPTSGRDRVFAAVARPILGPDSLLSRADAIQETESLLEQFPIVYPDDQVIRTAIRGMATYGLPWFDAHLWAYADSRGIAEILSEDFQHGRKYGAVRIINPFSD